MDENNNTDNRLNTVLGVEEDKSVGSKINSFIKKVAKIPDKKEFEIRHHANFDDVDREYKHGISRWNKMGKQQIGVPLVNYIFGDKRRVKDTKRLFADLEVTAKKSVMKYNERLNELQGMDRLKREQNGEPWGGEWAKQSQALANNGLAIVELTDELDKLKAERDELLQDKQELSLLPNHDKTMKAIEDITTKIAELQKKKSDMTKNSTGSVLGQQLIGDSKQKVMDWNLELTKLAAGMYDSTGSEKLFERLKEDIETEYENNKAVFMEQAMALRSQNTDRRAARKDVDTARKNYSANPTLENDKAVQAAEKRLADSQAIVDALSSELELAKQQIIISRERQKLYDEYYANKEKPQDFGSYKPKSFVPKFDASMRSRNSESLRFTKSIRSLNTSKQISDIETIINSYKDKKDALNESLKNITADKSMEDVDTKLNEKNKAIGETSAKLKDAEKQSKVLAEGFDKIEKEIKQCTDQLGLLKQDMNFNPFHFKMMSNDLQGINDRVLTIKANTKKWYEVFKKSNVLTRIGHRIMTNIRSQISDMINPLTLFRKGWDDWLNRFDNAPWKNTFDVIKYNLVTAFAPMFEMFAQGLIKLAQIGNVFIKQWTGVDLFDKSAWQLENIKKGMGQLTASFDELHSNTDNPNQFNTIFDTDPSKITPLSEELTSKLEKWATRIANAFKWIKDNWLILVGLWAGFKLAKGLLSILDWAGKLNNLFGNTLPISFGKFLRGLGWVAAGISAVVSTYETIKLGNKWDQMDDKEKNKTIGKSIGFGTIAGGLIGGLVGGPAGAAIGAGIGAAITGGIDSAISDYNGDDARAEITGAIGGAGIGAAIGTLIAPGIGTAIGAAVGAGIGWGVEKLGHLTFSNGGDYSNLKISTEDLAWANEQLATAQDNAYNSMYNLKLMEEQTGESGKQLYESVKNGSLSLDNMTSSQLAVYKAYKQHMEVLDELHKAQQTQMDYETSMDMDRAKKTDNYGSYIEKMIQANKDGIYSNEELEDRFAQMYGELDRGSRQAFLEQLPENMRTGVETAGREYMSNWSKFYDDCCTNWETFKTNAVKMWEDVKTGAAQKWEDFKTGAAETWENVKTKAGEKWEEIKNSAIVQKVQEIATNVSTKWNELKTNTQQKFQEISDKAKEKWNNIKTNITDNVKTAWENAKNKFEDLKNKASTAWENMKTKASTLWGNISKTISDKANEAWKNATNKFESIGKKAQETWQKVSNWFSGNGWKTNSQIQVENIMNDTSLSEEEKKRRLTDIPSYAVGTNYVPNDQLAMIHQGEAIIPKKYNKPYSPQANNSELESTISAMTQEIANLRSLVQQGIPVKGEFRQRGSDLVAVVEKGKNKNGNQTLSNPAYAR